MSASSSPTVSRKPSRLAEVVNIEDLSDYESHRSDCTQPETVQNEGTTTPSSSLRRRTKSLTRLRRAAMNIVTGNWGKSPADHEEDGIEVTGSPSFEVTASRLSSDSTSPFSNFNDSSIGTSPISGPTSPTVTRLSPRRKTSYASSIVSSIGTRSPDQSRTLRGKSSISSLNDSFKRDRRDQRGKLDKLDKDVPDDTRGMEWHCRGTGPFPDVSDDEPDSPLLTKQVRPQSKRSMTDPRFPEFGAVPSIPLSLSPVLSSSSMEMVGLRPVSQSADEGGQGGPSLFYEKGRVMTPPTSGYLDRPILPKAFKNSSPAEQHHRSAR